MAYARLSRLRRLRPGGGRAPRLGDRSRAPRRRRHPETLPPKEVEPQAAVWLAELHAAGIGVCLVSNGIGRRIEPLAASLGLPYVAQALKPLPWGCRLALRKMAFPPAKTAIVGDQIFADILAGRLAGLKTILVTPIHPEEEPWFTRLNAPPNDGFSAGWDKSGPLSPPRVGQGDGNPVRSPLPPGEG